jgi:error-prone DNA polymerase
MKVDCLALGMLSCMKRGLDLLAEHKSISLDLATIPAEDPKTYAMTARPIRSASSRSKAARRWGCCRASSRAFYDLVIEVAIVRPGPIQGDMVHPYLRRGCHIIYPKPKLERVLVRLLSLDKVAGLSRLSHHHASVVSNGAGSGCGFYSRWGQPPVSRHSFAL